MFVVQLGSAGQRYWTGSYEANLFHLLSISFDQPVFQDFLLLQHISKIS